MKREIKSFKEYSKRNSFKYAFLPILIIALFVAVAVVFGLRFNARHMTKTSSERIRASLEQDIGDLYDKMEAMGRDDLYSALIEGKGTRSEAMYDYYHFKNSLDIDFVLSIKKGHDFVLTSINAENLRKFEDKLRIWERSEDDRGIETVIYQDKEDYSTRFAIEKDLNIKGEAYRIIFYLPRNVFSEAINVPSSTINVLVGGFDQVLATNDNRVIGSAQKFAASPVNEKVLDLGGVNYYFTESELGNTGLSLITMNKMSSLAGILAYLIAGILGLLLVAWITINVSWSIISKKNTEAIGEVIETIRKNSKGDLESRVSLPVFEEFEPLYNEYNNMLISIDQLVKKNQMILSLNKVDHLKLLNSQFNPHFLFNTLESLRYLIMFDKDKANGYILDLSKILRYTIDNRGFYSTVDEEISYLRSYLDLQKMRYEDRLDYEIEVDEAVGKNEIPKLILQPIIENSLKYTYKIQDKLKLMVKVKDRADKIYISIEDDGPGIDEEELKKIKKNFDNYASERGIGFYNVNKKLSLLYEDYLFDIRNRDKGLLIEIVVEKEKYV